MGNIKKISIPGVVPSPTSFGDDDIVINTADGKIYIKDNSSTLRIINQNFDKDLPLDGNIIVNENLEFKKSRDSDNLLFISADTNNQPRIGIGTTDPKSTIDFKSTEDSTIGTEIILRTARSATTGALSGDEGGSINFTIDSGSFTNLKTSGSLAKIKTIVNSIGKGGAQGVLAFTLSKGAGPDGVDAFKYGYYIGGETTFAQIQTGSLVIRDFNSAQPSNLKMVGHDNTINFQASEGNITASGDISASGTIYANRFHSAQGGEAIDFNDSIDLEGNLTASGNISASGNIYANDLDLAGSVISQQLNVQGSITASGDISASGDLHGNNLNLAGSVLGNSLTLDSSGDAQIILDRGASSNDSEIIFKTNGGEDWSFGTGQIGGDSTLTMRRNSTNYFQLDEGGSLELLGNVSASGNISSSGTITANEYVGLPSGLVSESAQILTDAGANQILASNSDATAITASGILFRASDSSIGIGVANTSDIDARLHIVGTGTANNREVLFKVNNSDDHDRIEFIDEGSNLPAGLRNNLATYGVGIYANSGPVRLFSGGTGSADTILRANSSNVEISGALDVTGQLSINGFSDVSASLAAAGGGSADNLGNHTATQDLDLANFDITNVTSASIDYLAVNNKLQGSGSGFQFFAFNEDTVKVKFANWYSSNDRQYGQGQLWYETWFAAIDNQSGRDNRRIGFYLEEPDAGATDAVNGTSQHPSNSRFYVDITGSYVASGGLHVTDANFDVESNGNVSINGTLDLNSNNINNVNINGGTF